MSVCESVCVCVYANSYRLYSLFLWQHNKLLTCIRIAALDQVQTKEQSPLGDSIGVEW